MSISSRHLISALKKEKIETWFDLGLFLDRLKEKPSDSGIKEDFYSFKEKLVKGSVGFVSFYFGIDGITVETAKYTTALKRIIPGVKIHLIAGSIKPESRTYFGEDVTECELDEIKSFDEWELFNYFFKTKYL